MYLQILKKLKKPSRAKPKRSTFLVLQVHAFRLSSVTVLETKGTNMAVWKGFLTDMPLLRSEVAMLVAALAVLEPWKRRRDKLTAAPAGD